MKGLSGILVLLGFVILIVAVVVRVAWFPIVISGQPIKASSLLILANMAFILSLVFKKN
ncbi:MAG: hypothetical protein J7J54_02190 [Candidatus Omnitrophica bacterium]|nr:hypothetical protein [Candidatus Omnitrophota bacterium]